MSLPFQLELQKRFPSMQPITSPPPLFLLWGCGFGMIGSFNVDAASGTYLKFWCLRLMFIPVLPLRAYRVADAEDDGLYFLGREPLSARIKTVNLIAVSIVAGLLVLTAGAVYTSTPSYRARAEMSAAATLVESGKPGEAAKKYRRLALAGADQSSQATAELRKLFIPGTGTTAGMQDVAVIVESASAVTEASNAIPPDEIAAWALDRVGVLGAEDPQAALRALDAVRPLVVDASRLDKAKLPLLGGLLKRTPNDLALAVRLAEALHDLDMNAEARKVLDPLKSKLTGEGDRVYGGILAADGHLAEAEVRLSSYVVARLDAYMKAAAHADKVLEEEWERQVEDLRNDKAPKSFYRQLDRASDEQKATLVRAYVQEKLRNNQRLGSARDAVERQSRVVGVAMRLGMLRLELAQTLTDPAARESMLKSAETVLVAIGEQAGQSAQHQTTLATVYYRLGKQSDATTLFDKVLSDNSRSATTLLQVAASYRELGLVGKAKELARESFDKGDAELKLSAAMMLSVLSEDVGERIEWLRNAGSSLHTRASLAMAEAEKAARDGREKDAETNYRQAIRLYGEMPRGTIPLNQTAIAYGGLFEVTGDLDAARLSGERFRQAAELEPGDSVLASNAGYAMLRTASAEVLAPHMDLSVLRDGGGPALLPFLYDNPSQRAAVVSKLRSSSVLRQAIANLERATILAPKRPSAYLTLARLYDLLQDLDALTKIERRAREAGLDLSSEPETLKKRLTDPEALARELADQQATLTAATATVDRARSGGGRTLAVALTRQAEAITGLHVLGGKVDLDEAVRLADQAVATVANADSRSTHAYALMLRAYSQALSKTPDADQAWRPLLRFVDIQTASACVVATDTPFARALRSHPDFIQACRLIRADIERYPDQASTGEWALLRQIDPAAAEIVASRIKDSERTRLLDAVSELAGEHNPQAMLLAAFRRELLGQPAEATKLRQAAAARGLPMPPRQ
jgi:tetratricopeptide (TPR) repeat protein